MNTPVHSINIDFSHSSEAKLLHNVLIERTTIGNAVEEDNFLTQIICQLEADIELLESIEA